MYSAPLISNSDGKNGGRHLKLEYHFESNSN